MSCFILIHPKSHLITPPITFLCSVSVTLLEWIHISLSLSLKKKKKTHLNKPAEMQAQTFFFYLYPTAARGGSSTKEKAECCSLNRALRQRSSTRCVHFHWAAQDEWNTHLYWSPRSRRVCVCVCVSLFLQSVRTLSVGPGPGAVWAGSGEQPEARRAEGTAAATAPHTAPGAVLQRKVPETRTHQAGAHKHTQRTHTCWREGRLVGLKRGS